MTQLSLWCVLAAAVAAVVVVAVVCAVPAVAAADNDDVADARIDVVDLGDSATSSAGVADADADADATSYVPLDIVTPTPPLVAGGVQCDDTVSTLYVFDPYGCAYYWTSATYGTHNLNYVQPPSIVWDVCLETTTQQQLLAVAERNDPNAAALMWLAQGSYRPKYAKVSTTLGPTMPLLGSNENAIDSFFGVTTTYVTMHVVVHLLGASSTQFVHVCNLIPGSDSSSNTTFSLVNAGLLPTTVAVADNDDADADADDDNDADADANDNHIIFADAAASTDAQAERVLRDSASSLLAPSEKIVASVVAGNAVVFGTLKANSLSPGFSTARLFALPLSCTWPEDANCTLVSGQLQVRAYTLSTSVRRDSPLLLSGTTSSNGLDRSFIVFYTTQASSRYSSYPTTSLHVARGNVDQHSCGHLSIVQTSGLTNLYNADTWIAAQPIVNSMYSAMALVRSGSLSSSSYQGAVYTIALNTLVAKRVESKTMTVERGASTIPTSAVVVGLSSLDKWAYGLAVFTSAIYDRTGWLSYEQLLVAKRIDTALFNVDVSGFVYGEWSVPPTPFDNDINSGWTSAEYALRLGIPGAFLLLLVLLAFVRAWRRARIAARGGYSAIDGDARVVYDATTTTTTPGGGASAYADGNPANTYDPTRGAGANANAAGPGAEDDSSPAYGGYAQAPMYGSTNYGAPSNGALPPPPPRYSTSTAAPPPTYTDTSEWAK